MERLPDWIEMAELTQQQKKALALDKHISVTANAGSGKTRVLVERYVEAVKSGAGVEEILCLTFTEKAALELRQKIVERINAQVGASHDLPLLRKAKANMLEANISTIHSFCSQVLREFPIEAEVDANFKVLEDFDASILKEEACDKAVREALAEERVIHGRFHNFLVRIGYKRTLQLLNDLVDSREKIEHILVTGNSLLMNVNVVRKHWLNLSDAVVNAVRENVKLKREDVREESQHFASLFASEHSDLKNVLSHLKTLLSRILTNDGTPRKKEVETIVDGKTYSSEAALTVLTTAFESLDNFSSDSPTAAAYFSLIQILMELYDKAVADYTRKKFSMSALDFDDLQILTMRLIRENGNVRAALASRFKHIMVDEFQDTNFLQYDIFLSLLDNFGSQAKLFVVGDPKQSIYRFRNAQVEVSLKTENDLSERLDGFALPLVESFRMNAGLASFVNAVFSKAITHSHLHDAAGLYSVSQTEYDALVPRRGEAASDAIEIFLAPDSKLQHAEKNKDEVGGDSDNNGATTGELQATFVASRIRKMVAGDPFHGNGGETITDGKANGKSIKINYGDIAILLRSRTKLTLLEEALSEKRVPYVVTSGIGFYSAQEIFDLTNYLAFLLDNSSDIALLTVLRSPLFGISENELYQTSLCHVGDRAHITETLYENFRKFAANAEASDEVRYAASVLNDEIQLAHRLSIPQLVNRILERTGWLGAYRMSPTGDQRIANLRKLLNIAREFEERGFNNLYDFIERIKDLKDAREGQAPADETADAVKIMTVHAAKGLEFPIVVVPFCDAATNRRQTIIINDQVGVLPFIPNEVPAELSLYQKFENENERAEITRLFYVACTRAMDKLILTTSPKKSMNSFNDILSKTLDFSAVPSSGYYEIPGAKVCLFTEIPAVEGKLETEQRTTKGRQRKERIPIGELFLDPIPADIDGEIYSATLLQTFNLCPTKYFLKYRLGMPAPETGYRIPETESKLDEYDDSILSTVKGELIHAALHNLLDEEDRGGAEITKISKQVIGGRFGNSLDAAEADRLLGQVIENVRNAMDTLRKIDPSVRLNPGRGISRRKFYTEQTITRRFGSDFLTGTLDLLVEDVTGFHIFDYKTNRLDRGIEKIYSEYEIQMKLYASLCCRLKPGTGGVEGLKQDSFDVTIIFTREPDKYLAKNYSRKELESFEGELEETIRKIKTIGPANGSFPTGGDENLPTSTPHCHECEYFLGEASECLMKRR